MRTPQHFSALDFYRFVAAFGVLLLHMSEFSRYDTTFGFGNATADFYLFVDFFFILSGFVIGVTYFDRVSNGAEIYTFLRRRIARIYPLHLLTLLIYLAPAIVGKTTNAAKYDISAIAQQLLLVQSWPLNANLPFNFPAWSVSVEWAMYLLFPILSWIFFRVGALPLVAVAALGFVGIEMAMSVVHPPLWFADTSVIRALPTFVIGVLISRFYQAFQISGGLWIGVFCFAMAIAATVMHLSPYVVLALFSATVWFTAAGNAYSGRTIFDGAISTELGNASYALYMIHSITLTAAIQFVWPRLSDSSPPIWFGLSACVGTALLAIPIFHWFERPARDFISGRSLLLKAAWAQKQT